MPADAGNGLDKALSQFIGEGAEAVAVHRLEVFRPRQFV